MPAEITGPSFIAFIVEDLEASRAFWADAIGLRSALTSPPGAYVFETRSVPFAIRKPREGEITGASSVAVWFACEGDLDAYAARLTARNLPVSPIEHGPFGRCFTVTDPDGRPVTVHSTTARA